MISNELETLFHKDKLLEMEGTTVSDRTVYNYKHLIQPGNGHYRETSSSYIAVNKFNTQLWTVSGTSSTLTVSGHLESTNRCQVDFKMMKFLMCKCFLTEIVIIILLSASMSCSLKKANKIDNMQILLS